MKVKKSYELLSEEVIDQRRFGLMARVFCLMLRDIREDKGKNPTIDFVKEEDGYLFFELEYDKE
jgi:hypothetical protein